MPSVARVFRFITLCAAAVPAALIGVLTASGKAESDALEPVVIISLNDCHLLVAQQAKASADFTDSRSFGQSAIAAVSGPPPFADSEDIAIDITTEVQQRFGLSSESVLFKPTAGVGKATVKSDGSLTVNGQSLTDTEAHMLAVLCRGSIQSPSRASR
jgi:hypothetical protein